jgi:hypothetical protein
LCPATPPLCLDLAGVEVEFIVIDKHILRRDLVEAASFRDRATGFVHIGGWLEQEDLVRADLAFADFALKLAAPGAEIMLTGNLVDRHETDIVAVASILGSGIAKSDKQIHGETSRAPNLWV